MIKCGTHSHVRKGSGSGLWCREVNRNFYIWWKITFCIVIMNESCLVFSSSLKNLSFQYLHVKFHHHRGSFFKIWTANFFWFDKSLCLLEISISFFIHSLTQMNVGCFNINFLILFKLDDSLIGKWSWIKYFA